MSRSRSRPPSAPRTTGPQVAADALLDSDAAHPIRRALWLDALDLKLRLCLPPALAAHARLANVDRGRLVFLVDASAWHARLRLASTELLDTARSLGLEVNDLVVKVASGPQAMRPQEPAASSPRPVAPLSAAARDAFAAALAGADVPSPTPDPSPGSPRRRT